MESNLINFRYWLNNEKKIDDIKEIENIVACFLFVAKFTLNSNCIRVDITDIKSSKEFALIYEKTRKNKFFTVKDKICKQTYSNAIELYNQYLCFNEGKEKTI